MAVICCSHSHPDEKRVYVVAIGASAGGYPALEEFFAHLPKQPGVAFVVLLHLKRDHPSTARERLARHTSLEVCWATSQQQVRANCLYVLPENKMMTIAKGRLVLRQRRAGEIINRAVDIFFESLAADQGRQAIGIVLSGMGSDGAKGAVAIHRHGGRVMVQEPNSALFDSMPRMAIYTDDPDLILAPAQLARALLALEGMPIP
jgi:two-component system, chemotaxis family, protein-glutamate methylesterase/glutaminase